MKFIILIFLFIFLLIPLVYAETTFFDNPDDTFIMSNATTGGVTGGTTSGGSCTYKWSCTGWSECINGVQTRTCTNLGSCLDNKGKPIESQPCTVKLTAPENITPPTVSTKTPEEPKAAAITPTPSTTILLGLGVGLIAISIVITAIILKKRRHDSKLYSRYARKSDMHGK